jgi:hypothetical protein
MVLDKSISIRLANLTVDKLKEEAKNEGITLNTLVNQIFVEYLQWDRTASKAGWVVVLSDVVKKLMNELDDKTLYKIAVLTADSHKDIRLMMTGDDTLDGFFSILRNRLRKSGIDYTESHEKGMIKFVIHHNMGKKWSFFYKTQHERMLKNLGQTSACDFTDNTLVINVKIQ